MALSLKTFVQILMLWVICTAPKVASAQSCGTMKSVYTGDTPAFDAVVDLQQIVYCLSNKNLSYINEINKNLFQIERDVNELDEKIEQLHRSIDRDSDDAGQSSSVGIQFQELRRALADIKGRLTELELSYE